MATFGQLLQVRKMKEKRKNDLKKTQNIHQSLVRQSIMFQDPNPSLPVVEKTVYIRVYDGEVCGSRMDWYVVNLSSNGRCCGGQRKRERGKGSRPSTAAIEPIWNKVETPVWSCCVALGSTIYSIGGGTYYQEFSGRVRAADMSLSHIRQVARMNARRSCAHAVVADGKIYVFGGLSCNIYESESSNNNNPEIEVFDPSNDVWESVTPPAYPMSLEYDYGFFVTYDDASKRIICGSISTKCLLAYDVATKDGLWEVLNSNFEFRLMNDTKAAFFKNTLYWISVRIEPRAELVLYDMDLKMSASTTIIGLHRFLLDGRYYMPSLFHLRGDEFYLIWHDAMEIGEEYPSLVRCARILVSKLVDKQKQKISVEAYVVSTETYLLPRPFDLMDAVVV